jgi:hypothetical protein
MFRQSFQELIGYYSWTIEIQNVNLILQKKIKHNIRTFTSTMHFELVMQEYKTYTTTIK